jgi:glycosyltransferase involved in cell wall biosynthesis
MRICAVMKYPPIQGGVSARCYWIARALAQRGHQVHVVTNAAEVEAEFRLTIPPQDADLLDARFPNGGSVTVFGSGIHRRALAHVPYSNPYTTKLAALATDVIRANDCEVVFSYYYEPYGISAHLASAWTRVAHVVQHAGSDRGRLMNHPELATAYCEMLREATLAVTTNPSIQGLGIPQSRLAQISLNFLPRKHFHPNAAPMDLSATSRVSSATGNVDGLMTPLRSDVPVIGVLGKVGEAKGSYDLIAALGRLRAQGHQFTLLTMIGGADGGRFYTAIANAGLESSTYALPLLPHWRVPGFLRRCTAVAFLERRFPITAHRPGVPQEIMACGVCAVISREIADKQRFRDRLRHGHNALIVEDPTDHDELTAVLERVLSDPDRARCIGSAGAELVETVDVDELGETYESLLSTAVTMGAPSSRRRASPPDVNDDARRILSRNAPATVRMLSAELDATLKAVAAEGSAADDAASLAREALARLGGSLDDRAPDVQREMLRFERDVLWSVLEADGALGVPAFPRPPAAVGLGLSTRPRGERVPVCTNWIRIANYPANIDGLVAATARGASTDETALSTIRCDFAFQRSGNLERRVYRLGQATKMLLELCDGSRSVGEVESMLHSAGLDDAGDAGQAIDQLVRERVLYLW